MNNMTQEEKAKAYDGLIERLKDLKFACRFSPLSDTIDELFPELKESEDERIKKALINYFKYGVLTPEHPERELIESWIAWLEKQGEQKPVPKFKIGDTMRTLQEAKNGFTDGMPVVVSIDEEYYHCTNELIAIKDQDEYEYPPMNRKPASWSEEDEK